MCEPCQTAIPSQPPEPLASDTPPSRVFEDVSADIFTYAGNHYFIYVDRLSGWPTIAAWYGRDLCTRDVKTALRHNFADLGVPNRIRTDGGPQFSSSEFTAFAKKWGFARVMSTPHYPQSNGHAEAAVKSMKKLLTKSTPSGHLDTDTFKMGLLEWRNTPRPDGLSPAEILYGHPLRACIPAHYSTFASKWQDILQRRNTARREEKEEARQRYDLNTRPLKPIPIGASVRIQDHSSKLWNKHGTVISVGKNRDYRVQLQSGRLYWRNRRFIRPNQTAMKKMKIQPQRNAVEDNQPPNKEAAGTTSVPIQRRRRENLNTEPPRRSVRIANRRYSNV